VRQFIEHRTGVGLRHLLIFLDGPDAESFKSTQAVVELSITVGVARLQGCHAALNGGDLGIRRGGLQVSDAPRERVLRRGVRRLHGGETGINGGEAVGDGTLQISEAVVEASILLIEATIQLGNLIEDKLHVRLHSAAGSL
jgi:hypothetical protein